MRVSAQEVAEEAAAAAGAFISQAGTVLHACVQQSPALLESGGIGTRELIRLTQACGCPPTAVRLILECAHAAGLLAEEGRWLLATTGYDAWTAREPAHQYAQLALAWRKMLYTPTLVCDGIQDRPRPVLDLRPACDGCQDTRGALLERAAALGPRQAVNTACGATAGFGALISWHRPRALECTCVSKDPWAAPAGRRDEAPQLAPLLREAVLLGVLARGALSPLGVPLLTLPADPVSREAELLACARQVLSPLCETVRIGADLTARAPGVPSPRLAAVLDQMADREGGHPTRVWHITPGSLHRALEAGRTAEDITDALHTATGTPELPWSLVDLVNDTARGYGGIRLSTSSCVLHGTDIALLAEIAAHPRLAPLRLRPLAPTVLASSSPADTVLAALREAGYVPAREQTRHAVHVEQPATHRLPTPPPMRTAAAPLDHTVLAAALLSAPASSATTQHTPTEALLAADAHHLDTAALRCLAHAIDHHHDAAISYITGEDSTTGHTLRALELDPPYLHARTSSADEPRSFHLARIHDADAACTTPPGRTGGPPVDDGLDSQLRSTRASGGPDV